MRHADRRRASMARCAPRADRGRLPERRRAALLPVALLLVAALGGCGDKPEPPVTTPPEGWGDPVTWVVPTESLIDPALFVTGVHNQYWPLVAGTRWVYEARTDEGRERIEVLVLDETRVVAGIECVVVRDTVELDGDLVEDTYDWYAEDVNGNVWYMGEDTKEYEKGEVVSTAGSWEAGVDGALPGIKVWGMPSVNRPPYYQEVYPGKAEDLGRDVSLDGTASVPIDDYEDLLVVEEWNKLAPEVIERKYYAAGIGVVMEEVTRGATETLELVEFERP